MKFTGLAISGALVVSATASASTLTLTYLGRGHSVSTGVAYNSALSWNGRLASSYQTVTVGTHRFGIYGQERVTFCAQLFEGVTVGQQYTFDVVAPSQVPEANNPSNQPGPMGEIKATLVNDLYRRYYAGLSSAAQYGAFQLALYEITHENLSASSAASAVSQLSLHQGAFQANCWRRSVRAASERWVRISRVSCTRPPRTSSWSCPSARPPSSLVSASSASASCAAA